VDDFAGGVGAAHAGEAIAGVCAGAAKKESADGRFVARPIENRAHGEELVESEFAVENVAAGESVRDFEILGSDDLHAFHEAGKVRGVRGERSNDSGAEFAPEDIPIPFLEFIGSILNAGREDMFAFRSESRIENRGNGDIEIRGFREIAVLGGVEGAFEVVDFGADVDAAGKRLEKALGGIERQESRQAAKSEMDFRDRAVGTKILDAVGKSGIEMRRIDELEKSALGVDPRDDGLDRDFLAIVEYDSCNGTVLDANLPDFGIGTNFGAGLFCGFGESTAEVTKSAARKSRCADRMGIASGTKKKDGR